MKKLSILFLAAALSFSALTAEFGVGVFTSTDGLNNGIQTGIGATYENEYLFGTLGYSTGSSEAKTTTDGTETKLDSNLSGFSVSAAYKLPLSAENTALFGVRYTSLTGEQSEVDIDAASKFALTAGVKTALNSSVSLLAEVDVYSSTVYELDDTATVIDNETTGSNFLNGGRLGVTLTF